MQILGMIDCRLEETPGLCSIENGPDAESVLTLAEAPEDRPPMQKRTAALHCLTALQRKPLTQTFLDFGQAIL